jgi:peptidoglycan hydrolase-like protein with peptidoglycan-binding domain
MKKLLAGLFVFVTLTVGLKASAFTLSDALLQIQNLKNEIILLRASLKGSAFDPTKSSIEVYPPAYDVTQTSAIVGINVLSIGTSETGSLLKLYYGTIPHPTTTSVTVNLSPAIASVYQYKLTSLTCDTKYYYYGSIGTSYSPDGTFTTSHCENWVNTNAVTISYPAAASVTSSGVTFVGSITAPTSSPVTDYGVCYKKSGQSYGCLPASGTINGSFGIPVYGLTPSTTYYYYIYANNSASRVTSPEGTFTTTAVEIVPVENNTSSTAIPKVAIHTAPPGLTSTTAAVGGVITSYGSTFSISERGACYGLTSIPNNCVPAYLVQGPNDMFATKFTGLTPNTTYYYRIYVKYASGTAYSTNGTFKTLADSSSNTPVSLPNLVSSKVENISASYPLNTTVTFTGTVTNIGAVATTGTFNSHFELKSSLNSSTSVINVSAISSGIVLAGGTVKVSSGLNLTTAGNYSIRICADQYSSINNSGSIAESSELDNCGDWTSFVVKDSSVQASTNGVWTAWSNSGSCVGGYQIQTRSCTSLSPSIAVTNCLGDSIQKISCNTNVSSASCPTNVPPITCPPYQTEAVKDANGCIVKFQCTSESSLKSDTITDQDNTSTMSITSINRTLRFRMRGDDVKILQEFLGIYVDGIFGRDTLLAVKAWQAKNGLKVDGIFGYNSRMKAGLQ